MRKHSEICRPERGNDRARTQGIRGGRTPRPSVCRWGHRSRSPVFSEEGSWEESSLENKRMLGPKLSQIPDLGCLEEMSSSTRQPAATGPAPRRECILNQLKLSHGYN